jgi:acetyl-CoA carboxylase carboxyl transferase subunit beta
MSILDWFPKKKQASINNSKLNIPGNLWIKCFHCNEILYLKDLENNFKICAKCNHHFRLTPEERIRYTFDPNSFQEFEADISPTDFLEFEDTQKYSERIKKTKEKTGQNDAIIIGEATINRLPVNVGVMNFGYMGGSMGSVVGEKVTRLIERAAQNKNPLIIFTASGGARMQEGIISLMQMAKTSIALNLLKEAQVPYFCVLTDPTTGGTSASFAMLGDISIAEPGALISFAGPRVIEQTIKQKLPKGFQKPEFLLKHGMLDRIVNRTHLKEELTTLIQILSHQPSSTSSAKNHIKKTPKNIKEQT